MALRCDWLLPQFSRLTPNHEVYECLLPRGHDGYHLIQLNCGEYVEWAPDKDCHECAARGEECECFIYGSVSVEQAMTLLVTALPSKTP